MDRAPDELQFERYVASELFGDISKLQLILSRFPVNPDQANLAEFVSDFPETVAELFTSLNVLLFDYSFTQQLVNKYFSESEDENVQRITAASLAANSLKRESIREEVTRGSEDGIKLLTIFLTEVRQYLEQLQSLLLNQ